MSRKCFFICPIGAVGSPERKSSDQLLNHIIKPICQEKNFEVIRADLIHSSDEITQTIITHLQESELVIADLTNHNPNVFYEIGYRSAIKKPLIQLISENETIPFDVSIIRTIKYNLSDLDKVDETKGKLCATLDNIFTSYQDTDSPTPEAPIFNNHYVSLISGIESILEEIKEIKNSILQKDTQQIEQIIGILTKQIRENNNTNPEGKAMELFISELIKEPDKMINIVSQISKMSTNAKQGGFKR